MKFFFRNSPFSFVKKKTKPVADWMGEILGNQNPKLVFGQFLGI
jgi:hypothetical protein